MNKTTKEEDARLKHQRWVAHETRRGTHEEIAKYSLEKKALLSLKRHWARGQALDYLGQQHPGRNITKPWVAARLKEVDQLLDSRNDILPKVLKENERLHTKTGRPKRGASPWELPEADRLPSAYLAKGGIASTSTDPNILSKRFLLTNNILPHLYLNPNEVDNTIAQILGKDWRELEVQQRRDAIISRGTTIGMMGHGGMGLYEGHTKVVLEATYEDPTAVRKTVTRSDRKGQGTETEIKVSIPDTQRIFFPVPQSALLARTVPLGMCGIIDRKSDESTTLALSEGSPGLLLEMFSDYRNDIMRTELSNHEAGFVGNLKEKARREIHGAIHGSGGGIEMQPQYAAPGTLVLDKEIEFFGNSGFAHFCVYDGPRLWRKADKLWKIKNDRGVRYVVVDQINKIGNPTDVVPYVAGPGSPRQEESFKKWFVLKCIYNVVKWGDGAPHLTKLQHPPKPRQVNESDEEYRSELERWVLQHLAPVVWIPTRTYYKMWDPMLHRMRQNGGRESIRWFLVRPQNGLGPGKLTLEQLMLWKQGGVGGGYDVWLDNICDPVQQSFKLPGRDSLLSLHPELKIIQGGSGSEEELQLIDAMRHAFIEAYRENDERNRQYMSLLVETMGLSGTLPTQVRRSGRNFDPQTHVRTKIEGPGDMGSAGSTLGDAAMAQMAWGRLPEDDMDISDEDSDEGNLKKDSSGGSGQGGFGGGGKKRTRRRKKSTRRRKKKKKTRRIRNKRRKRTRVRRRSAPRRRTRKGR
jgi:hypothetical protein